MDLNDNFLTSLLSSLSEENGKKLWPYFKCLNLTEELHDVMDHFFDELHQRHFSTPKRFYMTFMAQLVFFFVIVWWQCRTVYRYYRRYSGRRHAMRAVEKARTALASGERHSSFEQMEKQTPKNGPHKDKTNRKLYSYSSNTILWHYRIGTSLLGLSFFVFCCELLLYPQMLSLIEYCFPMASSVIRLSDHGGWMNSVKVTVHQLSSFFVQEKVMTFSLPCIVGAVLLATSQAKKILRTSADHTDINAKIKESSQHVIFPIHVRHDTRVVEAAPPHDSCPPPAPENEIKETQEETKKEEKEGE